MATTLLPQGIIRRLNQLQSHFWWGENPSNHKIHFYSWEKLKAHKLAGGLGFRDPRSYNKAAIMKWSWRFLAEPQSLWATILGAKYLQGRDFWTANRPTSCSHIWEAILSVRQDVKSGMFKVIQDGKSTNIWEDRWIPDRPGPPAPRQRSIPPTLNLVSQLIPHQ